MTGKEEKEPIGDMPIQDDSRVVPAVRPTRRLHGFTSLNFGLAVVLLVVAMACAPAENPAGKGQGSETAEGLEPAEQGPEQPSVELIGTEYAGRGRDDRPFIGDCRPRFEADCDGDGEPEDLCVQSMIEAKEGHIPKHYLLVDVYKDKEWILRQKLELGFYWEERFSDFVDLDDDGKAELVTQVRLGPDCAGCGAYRIHTFRGLCALQRSQRLQPEPL